MGLVHSFLYLLLSLASLNICKSNDVPVNLNDDVLGLIVFKSDLVDPFSYLSSWDEDNDNACSWKFIQCDSNGFVSQVSLDGLSLSGKIGKGLQKLQHLKVFSISGNNISGDINPELGLVSSLESLNLSHNSLSGFIPSSLVNLTSLQFLDLSENLLSGNLPEGFFRNCLSIRYLSLAGNFLQGPIPNALGTCSSLNNLNLSNNHFSGDPSFFNGIWSLKWLQSLDLSYNVLSGSLPEGLSVNHNLKELQLQGNQFSGPLPEDIGLCPHLSRLDLSNNLFNGALPESVKRLSSLAYFSISNNSFTGDFPWWIGKMNSLDYLDLSNNGLTGSLSSSIGDLKSLHYLSLSNNNLTGSIPISIVQCNKLSVIQLRGNSFNGSIPEGLFNLGLEEVDFSGNELTGLIPSGSSEFLTSLRVLDLSENHLNGQIPADMGLSSSLRYLNLSWNNLKSRMPLRVGYFQNLTVLDLRNTSLFGSVPADICESESLSILQLDENFLTGSIPEEIGNCSSLYLLSLSHNNLTGSIPNSMSNLNKLKILKLEYNELTGEIPQELGKLESLLAVNISYNKLIGRLPVGGIFPSLDQSALQGNLGICSPLLKGPCKMNVSKPLVLDPYQIEGEKPGNVSSEPARQVHHHMFLSVSTILAISAAIAILFGVVIVCFINISARKRLAFVDNALESMCSSSSRSSSNLISGKLILFDSKSSSSIDCISNPESLLNKAAEIGEGIFGTVYKVSLGSQINKVAIKKLVTSNIIQNPEDFDREIRILAKAKHPNLISLKGYYWTPHLQLLVSDYAHNGSLQAKLHDRLPSAPPLSWPNRFKILLGTAKALAHLHHSFRSPIIHYNIKPSNILLDENYNAKICDFGLARLLTKLDKHVMSNRFQSAQGYVAPELACQRLRVTEKCDIYGFGILILELVTGRRAVEYGEDNVVILNEHVKMLVEHGNMLVCVDQSMGYYSEDEVMPVMKLALVCTSQIPSSRPSMAEVVQILQLIKTPAPQRLEMF